jgi:general L-amino acid transport system permease protein
MADNVGAASPQPLRGHARRSGHVTIQLVTFVLIVGLCGGGIFEAVQNLARAHVASGFGFWNNTAGFDISQTLIAYSPSTSTFGRAFCVGLINTLIVAAIGIVLATVLGFLVGIARLSHNWLVAKLASGYVELTRNVPLLLQLLFWYNAVLKLLPELRESVTLPGGTILNNRGLFLARPEFAPRFSIVLIVLALGTAATAVLKSYADRRHDRTGEEVPVLWPALGLIVVLPLVTFALAGFPLSFSVPHMGRFNVSGGVEILPEFAALVLALSVYTAGFIAEVVRAGMLSVSHGQVEAAQALGLRSGLTLRLIVLPQAMRVIIPPLTSQYLNLIKNSSLAVAIGYPDLVQVFAGTVLNITGQSVEVIAITMAVYLFISLCVSLLMNLYGRTTAIAER